MYRPRSSALWRADLGPDVRVPVVTDAHQAAERLHQWQAAPARVVARWQPEAIAAGVARGLVAASWWLRLQPSPPGWFDLGVGVPLMDTRRAQTLLGWAPSVGADVALLELLKGMRERAGYPTGPLSPSTGGPMRVQELASGVGARDLV
jgi:hypothetical protein